MRPSSGIQPYWPQVRPSGPDVGLEVVRYASWHAELHPMNRPLMEERELRRPQGDSAQQGVDGDVTTRLLRCWRFSNEDAAGIHLIVWGPSSCKGCIFVHYPRSGNTGTAAASRPVGRTSSLDGRTICTAKSISTIMR